MIHSIIPTSTRLLSKHNEVDLSSTQFTRLGQDASAAVRLPHKPAQTGLTCLLKEPAERHYLIRCQPRISLLIARCDLRPQAPI